MKPSRLEAGRVRVKWVRTKLVLCKLSKCCAARSSCFFGSGTVLERNSLGRVVARVIALRLGTVDRGRAAAGGLP